MKAFELLAENEILKLYFDPNTQTFLQLWDDTSVETTDDLYEQSLDMLSQVADELEEVNGWLVDLTNFEFELSEELEEQTADVEVDFLEKYELEKVATVVDKDTYELIDHALLEEENQDAIVAFMYFTELQKAHQWLQEA